MHNNLQNLKFRLQIAGLGIFVYLTVFIIQVLIGLLPGPNLLIFALQLYFGGVWWYTPKELKFKGINLLNFFFIITAVVADIIIALVYLGIGKGILQLIQSLFS